MTDVFDIAVGPPPETTILTGPAATVPDDWASFEFSSSRPNSTFECSIDNEQFEECFNPAQFVELEPGQHTFRVRALSANLVPDPTPATWTWEYVPPVATPETTIVTTPPNPQLTLNAVFQFSSSGGAEIEFECALDAEPFESCESPHLIEELPPGEHVFLVRAVDVFLGTVDPTPASYTWRSIAPPLEPTIESAPPDPSVGNTHTFSFSSTEPNATFKCRITPNPFHINTFEPCENPHTYTGLPDGEYLFEVLRGQRVRHRRRDPGRAQLRGRQPARHDDPRRPARHDREHDRWDRVRLQRARPRRVRVLVRRRAVRRVPVAGRVPGHRHRVARVDDRDAHVPRAGDRPRRQRRPDAGQHHLDRRRADGA